MNSTKKRASPPDADAGTTRGPKTKKTSTEKAPSFTPEEDTLLLTLYHSSDDWDYITTQFNLGKGKTKQQLKKRVANIMYSMKKKGEKKGGSGGGG
ncbi:hypothetical protein HK104_001936, partial [Borealophlyctis nickersoniae]